MGYYCDSGASCHIDVDYDNLINVRPLDRPVRVDGIANAALYGEAVGDLSLEFVGGCGVRRTVTFADVLVVPGATNRLISVRQAMADGTAWRSPEFGSFAGGTWSR